MRKISLIFLLIAAISSVVTAQVTSLNETFNTTCPAGTHGPSDWMVYSTTISITGDDQWTCGATFGRSGTPGISCSGFYGSPATNHIDTSFFISPELELSGYPGNVYLNYDTKCSKITLGAKLSVIATNTVRLDNIPGQDSTYYMDGLPIFGQPDSTDWVTHQINLTPYKYLSHLYVGFRYASATGTATASRWFLDNIYTTTSPLAVGALTVDIASFSIVGIPTTEEISVLCIIRQPGPYDIAVYDMVGRQVYKEQLRLPGGKTSATLRSLHLSPGMYMLKLSNEQGYSVTRAQVQ